MKSALAASALFGVASGHLCMWAPLQRSGTFEIVEPGQSICYLKQGPCGGQPSAQPLTDLAGGDSFDVLFQQNLNHFYQQNPGTLTADFAEVPDPTEADFHPLGQLADWNAYNMITQTNFSLTVQVPDIDCEHCVLRMRYVSQNPTEDHGGSPTFHQCADVRVKKSSGSKASAQSATTNLRHSKNADAGKDCCTPKQFFIEGYETGSWRNPTNLKHYFDSVNQLYRIDSDSGNGETTKDGKFQMFNDFKAGIEYYYHVASDVCELYGLNLWYDWCYGSVNHQIFHSSVRVGNEPADVWRMDGNDFFWTNTRSKCTPVSKHREISGETTFYYNMKDGLPEDYFKLPQSCLDAVKNLKTNLTASPHQF